MDSLKLGRLDTQGGHECRRLDELKCIARVIQRSGGAVNRPGEAGGTLPQGKEAGQTLGWDPVRQLWVPVFEPIGVASVDVVNTGSGSGLLGVFVTRDLGLSTGFSSRAPFPVELNGQNVEITSKSLISSDLSVSITDTMTGELDLTVAGGGGGIGNLGTAILSQGKSLTSAPLNLLPAASLSGIGQVYNVWARVVGIARTGPLRAASYVLTAAFFNNGGTLMPLGPPQRSDFLSDPSLPWVVGFSLSGSDLRVQIQGQPGTTIDWRASILFLETQNIP